MNKKQQAQQIFNSMSGSSRKQIIEAFVSQLSMTTAGASTYYANCKKNSQSQQTPEKTPFRVNNLFTIVTPREENGQLVVDRTNSYTSFEAALVVIDDSKDEIIVKGLPELDIPLSQLQCII